MNELYKTKGKSYIITVEHIHRPSFYLHTFVIMSPQFALGCKALFDFYIANNTTPIIELYRCS